MLACGKQTLDLPQNAERKPQACRENEKRAHIKITDNMDPIKIIQKFYKVDSESYRYLTEHSKAVAKKALEVAKKVPHLGPDLKFIEEAAMLHDIGIFLTDAPLIGCFGKKPYVCHGYLGGELLEKEGFPKHALVCERHVGVGLSIQDIEDQNLSLPKRDMIPVSIEEEIVCFADKVFSKSERDLTKQKNFDEIRKEQMRFGEDKVKRFDKWLEKFGY